MPTMIVDKSGVYFIFLWPHLLKVRKFGVVEKSTVYKQHCKLFVRFWRGIDSVRLVRRKGEMTKMV
jgi:hypothetical protein